MAWPRPLGHPKAGRYNVFVPDPIAPREFTFTSAAAGAIVEAATALSHLQATRPDITSLAALARNLLRSESAASSRIEGIQISHKRLARAAYARAKGRAGDNRAAGVLGNVDAMERAIEIGGNDYHPIGATYVGPPHEYVGELLEDLCRFIERTEIPPVAQAAIAHAQFENIHPFPDGNGRVGRALIYAVLRRRGAIPYYIPPVSLALAAQPKNYYNGLGAYSTGNVSAWSARFAHATMRAAQEAEALAAAIQDRQRAWLDHLGQPRRDAAIRQIISALPGQPIIDVPAAQQLTGKSHVAVGKAIDQLDAAGILTKLNERKWGRVWECPGLLSLVEEVEKRIATP